MNEKPKTKRLSLHKETLKSLKVKSDVKTGQYPKTMLCDIENWSKDQCTG